MTMVISYPSKDSDRYQKFRVQAVTDIKTLHKGNIAIYYVYCLGNKSFVSSEYIRKFKLSYDKGYTSFESFITKYKFSTRHCLNDCGMGDTNYNEHLIFLDENIAEEYAKACREDPREVERYMQYEALCDEFDKYDDNDYVDNRYVGDEGTDKRLQNEEDRQL
jgi:hypothetical protein